MSLSFFVVVVHAYKGISLLWCIKEFILVPTHIETKHKRIREFGNEVGVFNF
jgi:hypothetical protein